MGLAINPEGATIQMEGCLTMGLGYALAEEVRFSGGEVLDTHEERFARRPYFQCVLRDETGTILAKWFHGGYLRDRIKPGLYVAVHGKVSVWRETLQMINPQHQILWDPGRTDLARDELLPVYIRLGVHRLA